MYPVLNVTTLASAVPESQNLNRSCDLTTPLGGLICHPWASTFYDQSTNQVGSLYLDPVVTKIYKAIQNVENGAARTTEGHLKYHYSIERIQVRISLPQ